MNNQTGKSSARKSFQIITLILNDHQSNKFSVIAKEKDLRNGMIIQGKGTVNNHALSLLGIRNQRQNVINILTEKKETAKILNYIVSKLKISKSGRGIAYTTNVSCVGYDGNKEADVWNTMTSEEDEGMFKKLTVIVNRGMADDVMDIAREFGARGGTILHGRGTGAGCVAKLFGMEIEPEKELIIILLPTVITNTVTEALFHRLNLDIPGQGMLFVESVSDVKGIVEVTGDK